MVSCPWPFLCGSEGQKERHRATGAERESLAPVERDGVFILRLDDKREGRCFALYVGKHGAAEPLAMDALIDDETTDERRRQDRIARDAFPSCRRQIFRRNALSPRACRNRQSHSSLFPRRRNNSPQVASHPARPVHGDTGRASPRRRRRPNDHEHREAQ
jgi:hypothetical protein